MVIENKKFFFQTHFLFKKGPNIKMIFAYLKMPLENDNVVVLLTINLNQLWQLFMGILKFIDRDATRFESKVWNSRGPISHELGLDLIWEAGGATWSTPQESNSLNRVLTLRGVDPSRLF